MFLSAAFRSRDQLVWGTVALVGLVGMAASWVARGGLQGQVVNVESVHAAPVRFCTDINAAPLGELMLLPGIGERLARRWITSRVTDGPFLSHDELLRVKGIGPKKLAGLRHHLLPIEVAEQSHPTH